MTTRFSNSGRFFYAMGFKSHDAAFEALCDMINQGEMSEREAEIESYICRLAGREKKRFAISTPA